MIDDYIDRKIQIRDKVFKAIPYAIMVLTIVAFFFVSTIGGFKSQDTSITTSNKILEEWKKTPSSKGREYPNELSELVRYKGVDYYFKVLERDKDNKIVKWRFGYDITFEYILSDYKTYILTLLFIMVALNIADTSYTSSRKRQMESIPFLKALKSFSEAKSDIKHKINKLPDFCTYKNKQLLDMLKRQMVESVNLEYDRYLKGEYNKDNTTKLQWKYLNKIERIKVKKIAPSDLLHEMEKRGVRSLKILPDGIIEHHKKFLTKTAIKKILNAVVSGLVVSFGIIWGNWITGLVNAILLILTALTSTFAGYQFVHFKLIVRYQVKRDLLIEFNDLNPDVIKDVEVKEIQDVKEIDSKDAETTPNIESKTNESESDIQWQEKN